MGHHHGHSCSGTAAKNIGRALFLNVFFTIIEIIGGVLTGSYAILADAVHDLGDSITLLMAFFLQKISEKDPDKKNTYGYKRYSLLSALVSGIVIISGSIVIIIQAIPRLWNPEPVNTIGMILLAVLGTTVNGFAFLQLSSGTTQNEKVLKWHLFEDCASWLVVLIGAIFIHIFEIYWLDGVLAIGVALFVAFNVFKHLTETIGIFLQQTPRSFNRENFVNQVKSISEVVDVHDLHIWSLDGDQHVLSCHVVVSDTGPFKEIKQQVREIANALGEYHLTIEIEDQQEICSDYCGPI